MCRSGHLISELDTYLQPRFWELRFVLRNKPAEAHRVELSALERNRVMICASLVPGCREKLQLTVKVEVNPAENCAGTAVIEMSLVCGDDVGLP